MPALSDIAPELARNLLRSGVHSTAEFGVTGIECKTVMVSMRDGVRLATDLYLPPKLPAPAIVIRTPYGRAADGWLTPFFAFARRGYVVISQDCRGTGDSEPDVWDYYVYEPEDSHDCIDWIGNQPWFGGFIGSCGGSYVGQVQWQMALHPKMSTIVPQVSGLGVAVDTARKYMFSNAYARSVGKGEEKLAVSASELEGKILNETLAGGFFNEPLRGAADAQRTLWERFCAMRCAERAAFIREALDTKSITNVDIDRTKEIFGHRISHDAHTLPHPRPDQLVKALHSPILLHTGWYDWGLNDALETWELLRKNAGEPVRSGCRLLITPSAHNMPGYHEGMAEHPELQHAYGLTALFETVLAWFRAVEKKTVDAWPAVIYYLMGANEWRVADDWPVPGAHAMRFYLGEGGTLSMHEPRASTAPDRYTYDPNDPTPTLGGSIVSYVYPPGSVDVRELQKRRDVVTYTTEPFERDFDVVGLVRFILYASSSAVDTDFAARLSDVFPDGRAIQLQNGFLRARYRNIRGEEELLEPGRIYCFEIDLWGTANRFRPGHRLRVDISSADFPRFDRNSNRGGQPGPPIAASQTVFHDAEHPSHLEVDVL